jgi:thioredoxin reductase
MASDSYEVLILGGGNAGFGVTVPTRKAGLKVALVEERDLGGICPKHSPKYRLGSYRLTRRKRSSHPPSASLGPHRYGMIH